MWLWPKINAECSGLISEVGENYVTGIGGIKAIGPHVDVGVVGGRHRIATVDDPTVIEGIVLERPVVRPGVGSAVGAEAEQVVV